MYCTLLCLHTPFAGPEITEGVEGAVPFVTNKVLKALVPPHPQEATLIFPLAINELVNFTFNVVVPCPERIVTPAGTFHR